MNKLSPAPKLLHELKPRAIAIATSTGGPEALTNIMRTLKGVVPHIPIAITQHIGAGFLENYAAQISRTSGLPATLAAEGMQVEPGHIYIASADKHMVFTQTERGVFIRLDDGPAEEYCKPSANPMLRSMAKIYGAKLLCIVLTGMGEDGLDGARHVREAGGFILVQDQNSAVWGMPRAVYNAGLANDMQPINNIAQMLRQVCT